MESPDRENQVEEPQLWEDVYQEEDEDENDRVAATYLPPGPRDRCYQYIPGTGFSRYSTALKNLIPVRRKKKSARSLGVDESALWPYLTYSWLTPYMTLAHSKGLSVDDIPDPSPQDTCEYNIQRIENLWQEELARKGPLSASLGCVSWRFMRTRTILSSLIFSFTIILNFISVAFFMRSLLEYAESEDASWLVGLKWTLALTACELLRSLLYAWVWASNYRTAIRLRTAFLGMLYRKILRLHCLGDKSIGELINLFTNDGDRILDMVIFGPMLLGGPLSIILGISYVLWALGPWPVLGLATMLLFYPVQYGLSRVSGFLKRKVFIITDQRLTAISEILNSIKFIKLYSWSKIYIDKIEAIRKKELSFLLKAAYCQSITSSLSTNAPVIAAISTFLIHILVEKRLTASQAFPVLSLLLTTLRLSVTYLQYGLSNIVEFLITCNRFKGVLLLNETTTLLSKPVDKSQAICIANGSFCRYVDTKSKKIPKSKKWSSVSLKKRYEERFHDAKEAEKEFLNQTSGGANYRTVLFDINFFAPKGKLMGVCGPVGSGKSTLLSGILGQLRITEGKLCREGTCAYVPQQAWLLNATFKENILFGEKFIPRRYINVLFCCDLNTDINQLPGGDNTEIGERGVNLSGGQKQRISLARAVYSDRDIFLLDDPLSAVDTQVANHIFQKCILHALRKKTVVFVSHQFKFLNSCDEVVVMKDGHIVERGTPHELLHKDSEYKIMYESSAAKKNKEIEVSNNIHEKELQINNTNKVSSPSKKGLKEEAALTVQEKNVQGSIKMSTYLSYMNACGGILIFSCMILAMLFNIGSSAFSSWWLAMWIRAGSGGNVTIVRNNETVVSDNLTDNPEFPTYQLVYCLSIVAIVVTNVLRGFIFSKVTLRASASLHRALLNKLMKTYLLIFEVTPVGRFQNLFSKDINEIETRLPMTLESLLQGLWTLAFSLLFICLAFPLFVIPLGILLTVYYFINKYFRIGVHDLKRLDNSTRAPVLSNVSTTVQGLDSIHAYGKEKGFIQRFMSSFDLNTTCLYMCFVANRWLALRVDVLAVVALFCAALLVILMHGTVPPALAGLAVAYASTMQGMLQYTVRLVTDNEVKFISVERINSYIHNMDEEGGHGPKGVPRDTWPELGSIRFKNVELRYREGIESALKCISFNVRPSEKIGIVGRTGSGKSSILTALFRLVEVSEGSIIIDNLDISCLSLGELRSRMAIIPQDPVLFAGTLRSNLDPAEKYQDEEIWSALEKTKIKDRISSTEHKLMTKVSANGDNFSTGEKQLICLARALLKNTKILVLDEATSGLDHKTEAIIQSTIFNDLKQCTIIIIAHRLDTVRPCNRILVMDSGQVKEFDEPESLLKNPDSFFYQLTREQHHEGQSI